MIYRSKAPLRLGLAGGGSDVSPYSDMFGGAVLNATIDHYAFCTIEETDDNSVILNAADLNCSKRYVLHWNCLLMVSLTCIKVYITG